MNRIPPIAVLVLLIPCSAALSLPRFALMAGAKCGSCHVNPTGGQMRNEYGISYSMDKVPLEAAKEDDFAFSSKLTDNISIGGDYRGQFLVDLAADPVDSVKGKTSFHAMAAAFYGAVNVSRKITFYFKHDFLNPVYRNLSGPEIFVISRVLPGSGYIKGGAFLPNYGWKLDDHTAYTRGGNLTFLTGLPGNTGLIFPPNYKDVGVEIGTNIENCFISAGLFNGNGNVATISLSRFKAYVGKIEYMGSLSGTNVRLGVSGYGYKSYKMGGVTLGVASGDVVLLGEIDWTHHRLDVTNFGTPVNEQTNTMAAYGEIDYRAMQGLWLTGKFDMFDPLQGRGDDWVAADPGPNTNSLKRITLGIELFPYAFVEVRPQYRINMETPDVTNDEALIQMHVWF